jgi:hypothetical protein
MAGVGLLPLVWRIRAGSAVQYRFILDHDRIQLSSMLMRREMRKEDIAGVGRVRNKHGEHVTLISRDSGKKI